MKIEKRVCPFEVEESSAKRARDSDDPLLMRKKGLDLFEEGNFPEALHCFRLSGQRDLTTLVRTVQILKRDAKNYTEILGIIEEIFSRYREEKVFDQLEPALLNLRAEIFYHHNQFDSALKDNDRILEVRQAQPKDLRQRALILYRMSDFVRAEEAVVAYLDHQPDDLECLIVRIHALFMRDQEQGLACFIAYQTQYPNAPFIEDLKNRVLLGFFEKINQLKEDHFYTEAYRKLQQIAPLVSNAIEYERALTATWCRYVFELVRSQSLDLAAQEIAQIEALGIAQTDHLRYHLFMEHGWVRLQYFYTHNRLTEALSELQDLAEHAPENDERISMWYERLRQRWQSAGS